MKLSLIIHAEHHWQHSLHHGLQLAQAMSVAGHQVTGVFFYGQAVKICTEPGLMARWQAWHSQQTCDMMLCRTMLDQHQLDVSQSHAFRAAGMASWVAIVEQSDQTIEVR